MSSNVIFHSLSSICRSVSSSVHFFICFNIHSSMKILQALDGLLSIIWRLPCSFEPPTSFKIFPLDSPPLSVFLNCTEFQTVPSLPTSLFLILNVTADFFSDFLEC
ncbi:hypothetical protein X975_00876, partial [Stegodyphus mimosarum]